MSKSSQTLKKVMFVIVAFFGLVMVGKGISSLMDNVGVDLENSLLESGVVESAGVITLHGNHMGLMEGNSSGRNVGMQYFAIKLVNSDLNFHSYNSGQDYNTCLQKIQPGDKLSINYNFSDEISNNIVQVNKEDEILIECKSFRQSQSFGGLIILIGGIFILVMDFMFIRIYN